MKILLVNDDGYKSRGLKILKEIVGQVWPEAEVHIFAPSENIPGQGSSFTFGKKLIIMPKVKLKNEWIVLGTPLDCVEVACRLHKDYDLIISGINEGHNVGASFDVSGTVQSALHGWKIFHRPAIALSADLNGLSASIDPALEILHLIKREGHVKGLISVNFPAEHNGDFDSYEIGSLEHPGELVYQELQNGFFLVDLAETWKNAKYYSERSDVNALKSGKVSITLSDGAILSLSNEVLGY